MGHQDALKKSNDMQKIASQLVYLFTVMANQMGMICLI